MVADARRLLDEHRSVADLMATDPYEDCGLYVDAGNDDELMAILPQHFGVESEFSTLKLPGFEVDVEKMTAS